jgi:anti-sigma B factor antagonist
MNYQIIEGPGDTATVVLEGKLDIEGAGQIEQPMATLAGSKTGLILDLTKLTFVASIGLRHMVSAARTLARKGGRVVLLSPIATVAEVLTTSGLTEMMPIAHSASEASAMIGRTA